MDTSQASSLRVRPSIMTFLFLFLLLGQMVSANVLNWRQADNTDKSTVLAAVTAPSESSATSVSSLPTGSTAGAESASSISESSIPGRPVLASATTSGTETESTATPTSTASNSTASDNSTLNQYNDPSFCHVDYTPGVELNPFCEPVGNSTLDVNASYEITWDAHWFDQGSAITILVFDINATEDGQFELFELTEVVYLNVSSALGHAYFNTTPEMLNGSAATALSLYANSTRNGQPVQFDGPVVALIDRNINGTNSTADHSGGGSSSSKKLGEKVGIPIGLIFLLIILAVLAFFFLRYRRRSSGYASNKSHVERTSTGSTRQSGGLGRGHKRQESFHDEPTSGGVELQNRNRGLTGEDTWEWGRDSVGSPTSPTSGNQFRDELARQKTVNQR